MIYKFSAARPYAKAIFLIAKENKTINEWSQALSSISNACKNKNLALFLADPRFSVEKKIKLLHNVKVQNIPMNFWQFIERLLMKKKLMFLTAIESEFEALRSKFEKKIKIIVTSARPLKDDQKIKLQTALEKKLRNKIFLTYSVNTYLIGGITLSDGKHILDASLRGRLKQIHENLI